MNESQYVNILGSEDGSDASLSPKMNALSSDRSGQIVLLYEPAAYFSMNRRCRDNCPRTVIPRSLQWFMRVTITFARIRQNDGNALNWFCRALVERKKSDHVTWKKRFWEKTQSTSND